MGGLSGRQGTNSLDLPNQEAIAIDGLTLEQYHEICYWNLSRCRTFDCSTSAITPNAIITCPSGDQLEDSVEIARFPGAGVYLDDWTTAEGATGEVMEGGWTRYYEFILAAW
jgi:hypothetical protein